MEIYQIYQWKSTKSNGNLPNPMEIYQIYQWYRPTPMEIYQIQWKSTKNLPMEIYQIYQIWPGNLPNIYHTTYFLTITTTRRNL